MGCLLGCLLGSLLGCLLGCLLGYLLDYLLDCLLGYCLSCCLRCWLWYRVGLVLAATQPLGEHFVEQVFLVIASGEQFGRLVFALAVGYSVVEVDLGRHLERLVLAPERREQLVVWLAVEVDPERHLE